ncbi:hypothetical protein HanXRQr2_Chr07g0282971 [Helianthus annuus]|uniref:Uncharacterized protein n=1 Tax=Helianthus annuus TaxID=4232 RepID=A0A9K3IJH9_HELAN|nr:hypothetical protein HanXRQr2_Chr07g0282971 [Helianthus annuus]
MSLLRDRVSLDCFLEAGLWSDGGGWWRTEVVEVRWGIDMVLEEIAESSCRSKDLSSKES